jgi:hypothetical protein
MESHSETLEYSWTTFRTRNSKFNKHPDKKETCMREDKITKIKASIARERLDQFREAKLVYIYRQGSPRVWFIAIALITGDPCLI